MSGTFEKQPGPECRRLAVDCLPAAPVDHRAFAVGFWCRSAEPQAGATGAAIVASPRRRIFEQRFGGKAG